MSLTIGTGNTLNRLSVLEGGVYMRIMGCRDFQVVVCKLDSVFNGVPERGVATLVDELVLTEEDALGAANAGVHAQVVGVIVLSRECSLTASLLRNVVLVGGQFVSEVPLNLLNVVVPPGVKCFLTSESTVFAVITPEVIVLQLALLVLGH